MADYLKANSIIEGKVYIGEIPVIIFRPKESKGSLPTIILYHGQTSNNRDGSFCLQTKRTVPIV